MKHRRAIVIPDQHFPIHDVPAVNVVVRAIEVVKPDIMINLGDIGEWESVSAWRWKGKKLPDLTFQLPLIDEEIAQVNAGLDIWDEASAKVGCKTKYMLQGNHDAWLDMFVENKVGDHPALKGYKFDRACNLKKRGYKYYQHNRPLKIGKLNFIHGAYATVYHAKKHLESYGANIIYAHVHDCQRHTLTKLDAGTIGSWAVGNLKDHSAEKNKWLRGRLHNWQHAFAIVDWYTNGNFKVEVVDIQNGMTYLWGDLIDGNEN
jgi:3',5'-cyclic AMP phosphodiesterase CpdA